LAFKGDTDDIRESPAIDIVRRLLESGATVAAYDPAAIERAREVLPPSDKLHYAASLYEAAKDVDAVLILTDWKEFAEIDLVRLNGAVRFPIVIDGRNLYKPQKMLEHGFTYVSIGRPASYQAQQGKPRSTMCSGHAPAIEKQYQSGRWPEMLNTKVHDMRILVTGVAGFLGSHLADRLLAEGHTVAGVDNLCTGNRENIAHLAAEPRFHFEERDICQPFDPGPVDYVFNFASPASPQEYLRLAIETLSVGSAGVENTLEIAARYGAGYLHASTSECYGDPLQHPQTEDYWGHVNPVGPRSGLRRGQALRRGAGHGLPPLSWRRHAPRAHLQHLRSTLASSDGRVISNLMMQALRGEPLTIMETAARRVASATSTT